MDSFKIIDLERTGENIRVLREKNGLSVKDLQNIFGFTTTNSIYKWQYGKTLPTVDNLVMLANLFNVNIEDILVMRSKV